MIYNVYKIIDIRNNNVIYVDVTKRELNVRFKEHKYYDKKPIYKYMEKNGFDNFNILLIEQCENGYEREIYWIKYYSKLYQLINDKSTHEPKDYGHVSFNSMKQYVILVNTEERFELSDACKKFNVDNKLIFEVCNKERIHEHFRIWRYEDDEITGHEFDFLKGKFYSPNNGKVFKDKKQFKQEYDIVEANQYTVLDKYYYVYEVNNHISISSIKNDNSIITKLKNYGIFGDLKFIGQFNSYQDALEYKNIHKIKMPKVKQKNKKPQNYDYFVYKVIYCDNDIFTRHPEPRKKLLIKNGSPIFFDICKDKNVKLPKKVENFVNNVHCKIDFIEKLKHKKNALLKVKELIDEYTNQGFDLYNDKNLGTRHLNDILARFITYYIIQIKDVNNNTLFVLATSKEQIEHQYHIICKTKNFKDTHYIIVDICSYYSIGEKKEYWYGH